MFPTIRVLVAIVAGLVLVGGLLAVLLGGPAGAAGLWGVLVGGFVLAAVVLERTRYRSLHAERASETPGPGGGEDHAVEPRFRPTDEIFDDPTTERRMRVWVDSRTGERRYIAEN